MGKKAHAASFKHVVKYCVIRQRKAVKLSAKIMEFLGFRCGENKRRRKDKTKEEPIMRKTARKLLKRLLKAERKVEQPRAHNYGMFQSKKSKRNVSTTETSRSPLQKIKRNWRKRERWLENKVSDTVKKERPKCTSSRGGSQTDQRHSQTGWPRNVPWDELRRVSQIPRRRKQK